MLARLCSSSSVLSSLHGSTIRGRLASTTSFDYLVIGGGSGGLATARRAALRRPGLRIGLIERQPALGGTCVNVGCVPKKVMWNAASMAEVLRHDAGDYGFQAGNPELNWAALRAKRDGYIRRLNDIYARNVDGASITRLVGDATFLAPHRVAVLGTEYTAEHVCIAVGGRPSMPQFQGCELAIDSDGFFELAEQPRHVTIVGAGYIGVEIAGIFASLGSKVRMVLRGERPLRHFDELISRCVLESLERQGVEVLTRAQVVKAQKQGDGSISVDVATDSRATAGVYQTDCLLFATGREPNTSSLNLTAAGIRTTKDHAIVVDEYENTSTPQHYAIGDVTGKMELTPVAIAAGRRLAERVFNNQPDSKLDYQCVPTVVFSHPPAATVGLTEEQAVAEHGAASVRVYTSKFVNMYYAMRADNKPTTHMKLVTVGPAERIVGIHMVGLGVDEILQGFAVAVKMGATKKDFDSTVAIHPTAAEELVTMT